MRLKKVRIRGAIGIKKGLGLNEISLDLDGLSGLVVLDGPNGVGKTTLLDNMQPFRILPSRKAGLANHFFLRDSCRELVLEHEGTEYRLLVRIDAEKGKQEGYIYVNGSNESLTTGKVREYDAEIKRLFGSKDLFLSSVFCAQGTDDSQLGPAELKKQFVEFLNIQKYQAWADTAKAAGNILKEKIAEAERQIKRIDDDPLPSGQEINAAIKSIEKEIEALEHDLRHLDDIKTGTSAKREELVKKIAKAEAENEKINILRQEYERLCERKSNAEADYRQRLNEISDEILQANLVIQGKQDLIDKMPMIETAKYEARDVEAEIANKQKVLAELQAQVQRLSKSESDDYRLLRERAQETQKKIKEFAEKLSQKDIMLAAVQQREHDIKMKIRDIKNNRKLSALQYDISAAKATVQDLDKRDPACTSETCSFIVSAIDAQKRLPGMIAEAERLEKELDGQKNRLKKELSETNKEMLAILNEKQDLDKSIQACNAILTGINDEERQTAERYQVKHTEISREIDGTRRQIDELRVKLDAYRDLISQEAEAKAASVEIKNAEKQIKKLKAEREKLEASNTEAMSEIMTRMAKLSDQINANNVSIDLKDELAGIDSELNRIERAIQEKQAKKNNLRENDLQELSFKLKMRTKLDNEKSLLETRIKLFSNELSDWAYLTIACGKNGIQALEIDAVAPAISGVANALLSETFGPTFQVRLDTLNDAAKETLDIWVSRPDGSEVLLDDLSGGEKVWVLKALRLARTIIIKEKSGRNLLTCFGDEEDGALRHGETSLSFIGLYREFLRLGGFQTCFYISHKPECIGAADYRLVFEPGNGITVDF